MSKGATRARSPKDEASADNINKPMVITSQAIVQTNVNAIVTLSALFETNETVLNLEAFCQVSTNFGKSWQTIASKPYTNSVGGVFATPYTVVTPCFFFRFGYSLP
jgi:hypothetical protein